jgi:hypothetical protein
MIANNGLNRGFDRRRLRRASASGITPQIKAAEFITTLTMTPENYAEISTFGPRLICFGGDEGLGLHRRVLPRPISRKAFRRG